MNRVTGNFNVVNNNTPTNTVVRIMLQVLCVYFLNDRLCSCIFDIKLLLVKIC